MKLASIRPQRNQSIDPFFHLFDEFFAPPYRYATKPSFTRAALNVLEYDDHFELQLAIPGFTKDNFNIEIVDNQLKVALQTPEVEEKGEFKRKEFQYGAFDRNWELNDDIDQGSIEANYRRGILYIKLNKKEEAKKLAPRTIEIS